MKSLKQEYIKTIIESNYQFSIIDKVLHIDENGQNFKKLKIQFSESLYPISNHCTSASFHFHKEINIPFIKKYFHQNYDSLNVLINTMIDKTNFEVILDFFEKDERRLILNNLLPKNLIQLTDFYSNFSSLISIMNKNDMNNQQFIQCMSQQNINIEAIFHFFIKSKDFSTQEKLQFIQGIDQKNLSRLFLFKKDYLIEFIKEHHELIQDWSFFFNTYQLKNEEKMLFDDFFNFLPEYEKKKWQNNVYLCEKNKNFPIKVNLIDTIFNSDHKAKLCLKNKENFTLYSIQKIKYEKIFNHFIDKKDYQEYLHDSFFIEKMNDFLVDLDKFCREKKDLNDLTKWIEEYHIKINYEIICSTINFSEINKKNDKKIVKI